MPLTVRAHVRLRRGLGRIEVVLVSPAPRGVDGIAGDHPGEPGPGVAPVGPTGDHRVLTADHRIGTGERHRFGADCGKIRRSKKLLEDIV